MIDYTIDKEGRVPYFIQYTMLYDFQWMLKESHLEIFDTQEEIEENEEYSIFSLRISPEFDFYQEILSNGEDIEVLEPKWMREEIGDIIHRMWNKYKNEIQ